MSNPVEFFDDQPANNTNNNNDDMNVEQRGTTDEPATKRVKSELPTTTDNVAPIGKSSLDDIKTLSAMQRRRGEILANCEDTKITIDKASLDTQEEYFALIAKENALKKVTAEYVTALKGHGNFSEREVSIWCQSLLGNDMDPLLQEQICTFAGASKLYGEKNDKDLAASNKRVRELEGQIATMSPKNSASTNNNASNNRKTATAASSSATTTQPAKNLKPVDSYYDGLAPSTGYGRKQDMGEFKVDMGDFSNLISKYYNKK
jgi:hypothetical protein